MPPSKQHSRVSFSGSTSPGDFPLETETHDPNMINHIRSLFPKMGVANTPIGLVLWKNFTIRRRNPFRTIIEILTPLLIFGVLSWIRSMVPPVINPECHMNAYAMPSAGILPWLQSQFCNFNSPCGMVNNTQGSNRIEATPTEKFGQVRDRPNRYTMEQYKKLEKNNFENIELTIDNIMDNFKCLIENKDHIFEGNMNFLTGNFGNSGTSGKAGISALSGSSAQIGSMKVAILNILATRLHDQNGCNSQDLCDEKELLKLIESRKDLNSVLKGYAVGKTTEISEYICNETYSREFDENMVNFSTSLNSAIKYQTKLDYAIINDDGVYAFEGAVLDDRKSEFQKVVSNCGSNIQNSGRSAEYLMNQVKAPGMNIPDLANSGSEPETFCRNFHFNAMNKKINDANPKRSSHSSSTEKLVKRGKRYRFIKQQYSFTQKLAGWCSTKVGALFGDHCASIDNDNQYLEYCETLEHKVSLTSQNFDLEKTDTLCKLAAPSGRFRGQKTIFSVLDDENSSESEKQIALETVAHTFLCKRHEDLANLAILLQNQVGVNFFGGDGSTSFEKQCKDASKIAIDIFYSIEDSDSGKIKDKYKKQYLNTQKSAQAQLSDFSQCTPHLRKLVKNGFDSILKPSVNQTNELAIIEARKIVCSVSASQVDTTREAAEKQERLDCAKIQQLSNSKENNFLKEICRHRLQYFHTCNNKYQKWIVENDRYSSEESKMFLGKLEEFHKNGKCKKNLRCHRDWSSSKCGDEDCFDFTKVKMEVEIGKNVTKCHDSFSFDDTAFIVKCNETVSWDDYNMRWEYKNENAPVFTQWICEQIIGYIVLKNW